MDMKKDTRPPLSKNRKSYYDFRKDYPGNAYTQMRKQENSEIYDTKGKIKLALCVLGVVVLFLLAYFVTYTLLEISHQPIG